MALKQIKCQKQDLGKVHVSVANVPGRGHLVRIMPNSAEDLGEYYDEVLHENLEKSDALVIGKKYAEHYGLYFYED